MNTPYGIFKMPQKDAFVLSDENVKLEIAIRNITVDFLDPNVKLDQTSVVTIINDVYCDQLSHIEIVNSKIVLCSSSQNIYVSDSDRIFLETKVNNVKIVGSTNVKIGQKS